jgi:hypothetical protein
MMNKSKIIGDMLQREDDRVLRENSIISELSSN